MSLDDNRDSRSRYSGSVALAMLAVTAGLFALLLLGPPARLFPPGTVIQPVPITYTATPLLEPTATPDLTHQATSIAVRAQLATAQAEADRRAATAAAQVTAAGTAIAHATERAATREVERALTPTAVPTATVTATVPPTALPTETPAPEPQPTEVPAVPAEAPTPENTPVPEDTPTPPPAAPVSRGAVPRLMLASYLAWYDADGWADCNISAGDSPAEPYGSDDSDAIGRQVQQALGAGIDGFLVHWNAPGDRTDANLAQVLVQSGGTSFQSSVVFLRHLWHGSPGSSQDTLAEALSYLISTYGSHPNFLRVDGKPVLFFADMPRVPGTGAGPVAAWQVLRDRVDPDRQTLWIAEGLDPSYLSVFDGLYVYKVTHAVDPTSYVKATRWAQAVRNAEAQDGRLRLWVGTISPGFDDTRAGCQRDTRVPSAAHRLGRANGATYRAIWDAAMASNPDWLLVQSWNEWVEGTYVEPSVQHGDLYLQMTREFANAFH